jgi:hypothetical protein
MTAMTRPAPHPYLRAYMAGIVIPTAALLMVLAAFVTVHHFHREPLPIDRVLVFPMAIAPNLWGAWNMLYVALRRRRRWPLAAHGVILSFLAATIGWAMARSLGLPIGGLRDVATALPFVVVMYYLLWKYGVRALNDILGIA